jgi:hypothetical protein
LPLPTPPKTHDSLSQTFAPHFSNCIWQHAQVLLPGAILAPSRRTDGRAAHHGLEPGATISNLPPVLSRAVWMSWALSHTLLQLLVQTFVSKGPVNCALDPTVERQHGAKVKAKGIYRDPVRSSHSHFVKASRLR